MIRGIIGEGMIRPDARREGCVGLVLVLIVQIVVLFVRLRTNGVVLLRHGLVLQGMGVGLGQCGGGYAGDMVVLRLFGALRVHDGGCRHNEGLWE